MKVVTRPKAAAPVQKEEQEAKVDLTPLFSALDEEPLHWRVFISLLLAGSLERSEALALERRHIDLDAGTVRIAQAWVKGIDGPALKHARSIHAERTVRLPEVVVELLREFLSASAGDTFLFVNQDGKPFYPDTATRWWSRFLERKKLSKVQLKELPKVAERFLSEQGIHQQFFQERHGRADRRFALYLPFITDVARNRVVGHLDEMMRKS